MITPSWRLSDNTGIMAVWYQLYGNDGATLHSATKFRLYTMKYHPQDKENGPMIMIAHFHQEQLADTARSRMLWRGDKSTDSPALWARAAPVQICGEIWRNRKSMLMKNLAWHLHPSCLQVRCVPERFSLLLSAINPLHFPLLPLHPTRVCMSL